MTHEHDDGLTDEERAAIQEDEGSGTGDEGKGEGDEGGDGDGDAGAASEDKGGEGKGDDAAGDDKGDAGDAGGRSGEEGGKGDDAGDGEDKAPADDKQEGAPILVVQPPADVEAKLTEIATAKSDLATKFDDGDITAKEYQTELDKLAKQEREVEWSMREAELAGKLESQRQANEWKSTVDSFIRENPRYSPAKSESMYKLLDLEVRRVAVTDEFKGRNDSEAGRAILKRAHENLAKELGFDAKPPAKDGKKQEGKDLKLPPSLDKLPASEHSDTSGGKYATLDRLAATDPIAYEEALMKLPEAERNAYLAA